MSKSIIVVFPHQLGVAEAKRRIAAQAEEALRTYVDKIGSGELTWDGDTGHVRVSALSQAVNAQVEVKPAEIRVEIHLPWLLAAFSNAIEARVKSNASAALRLGTPKKV
ncbi:MAG: polyhydroxyalkanoic acid system family protein [Beijerinckiaceae bacterium]|nr:polyhydroxyalkanoic acid system family protein [Beijerinckiaceae bacterium]